MKICTIVGTRPEIIRLSETIKKLDEYTEHKLVHTGQSFDYELSQIFFDQLKIRQPDLSLKVASTSLGRQLANIMELTEQVLINAKPDAVVVLGDTNSCLSAVIAKRMNIKVFHFEAGNRCFNDRTPEEINRRIIDHISDVNICYTEHSRRNLLREGLHPKNIYVLGTPLTEVYGVNETSIELSGILQKLGLVKDGYFVASIHREENLSHLSDIVETLEELAEEYQVKVVFTAHPRVMKEIKSDRILVHRPFGMFDYIKLQKNALCNLSDSGTIHEDAALLGIKAVNVRESQERPEVYDQGNVIMTGLTKKGIIESVGVVIRQSNFFNVPQEYIQDNFSDKALRLIMSEVNSNS